MKDKICIECGRLIKAAHFNRKRCDLCIKELLRKPKGNMTQQQIMKAKKMAGKMDRRDIAKKLGVSLSNLKRSMPGTSFSFHNKYAANPDLVSKVCAYYELHGRRKTEKRFPNVRVRSIVERYKKFSPRQSRWSDQQKVELARMAGLIPYKLQAVYFQRPLANAGSIHSAFAKRVIVGNSSINGLYYNNAIQICRKEIPFIRVFLLGKFKKYIGNNRKLCLWVDIEENLLSHTPSFIKSGVEALAEFQRRLHSAKNNDECREAISKMLMERCI